MKKYDRDQAEKYTRVFGKLVDLHDLYVANKREIKEKDKKEIENDQHPPFPFCCHIIPYGKEI